MYAVAIYTGSRVSGGVKRVVKDGAEILGKIWEEKVAFARVEDFFSSVGTMGGSGKTFWGTLTPWI